MTLVNLESVRAHVEILRFCKTKEAELKELRTNAEDAIKEALGVGNTGVLDGEIVCEWSTYKSRTFDKKAFAEAHPDLASLYDNVTEKNSFKVK